VASQLYPKGAENILEGNAQFGTHNFKVLFYSGSFNSAHEFHSDLTGTSIIATSGNLASVVATNGVVNANDITITAVTGSAFTHVILFRDTGTSATSPLIAIFDVASFTPTGGDVNVVFHTSGLFSIA